MLKNRLHRMDLLPHVHDPSVPLRHGARGMAGEHLGSTEIPVTRVERGNGKMSKAVNAPAFHVEVHGPQKALPPGLDDALGHVGAVADLLLDAAGAPDDAGLDLPREEPAVRVHLAPVLDDRAERRRDVNHFRPELLLLPPDDAELAVDHVFGLQVQDFAEPERRVRGDRQEDVEDRIRLRGPGQDPAALGRRQGLRAGERPGGESGG